MALPALRRCAHVLPNLPVRQWVLAVPKRLRHFLERDAEHVRCETIKSGTTGTLHLTPLELLDQPRATPGRRAPTAGTAA